MSKERNYFRDIKEANLVRPSHIVIYEWAVKELKGVCVCDIACGCGYGSKFLSQHVEKVVGIDISQEAIEWACDKFVSDNLSFYCSNILEDWPVEHQFDTIVSIETLEHVEKPEHFLASLANKLKPNGKLIMSIPNGPLDKSNNNPYHIHYFDSEEISSLIKKYFSGDIAFFSMGYKKNIKHYFMKYLKELGIRNKKGTSRIKSNWIITKGLDKNIGGWMIIANKR